MTSFPFMQYLYILFLMLTVAVANAQNTTSSSFTDSVYSVKSIEVMPQYPGGMARFYEFIGKKYRFPPAALEIGVSGRLIASFVVEKDGTLTDISILKDLGYGTAQELIKVLNLSEKWTPGKQDGRLVRVRYTLPVALSLRGRRKKSHFNLPSQPAVVHSSTSAIPKTEPPKLPALSARQEKFVFEVQFNECKADTFLMENKKLALSDRYSVLQLGIEAIPPDSLKTLQGRISLQVLIDTTGSTCLISLKNELNMPYKSLGFDQAIRSIKWSLAAQPGPKKQAVSAILIFTFTTNEVKYQHLAFGSTSVLTELEASTKGKFSRY
jgi:hypothetical protein